MIQLRRPEMRAARSRIIGIAAASVCVLLLAGCATLNVRVPDGIFMSTGDYVPGIKTLGVIQESRTIFAPLFLIDVNKVNQGLYEALIRNSRRRHLERDASHPDLGDMAGFHYFLKPSGGESQAIAILSGCA
jgi:hypothetical protein